MVPSTAVGLLHGCSLADRVRGLFLALSGNRRFDACAGAKPTTRPIVSVARPPLRAAAPPLLREWTFSLTGGPEGVSILSSGCPLRRLKK